MKDVERLTYKQRRYVERLASGMDSRAAATAVGYSKSYAKVAAHRLKKNLIVAKALESIHKEARAVAVYGAVEAMAQAQEGIELAKLHKNPMAFIKGCELRSKLSGLLIDKVEVVTLHPTGALEAARTRVFRPQAKSGSVDCGAGSDPNGRDPSWD